MMDGKSLFVDTNILIYANVTTAPYHEQALNVLKATRLTGRPLWISRQVVREFIATRTRPQTFAGPLKQETLIKRIHYLENHFRVANDTAAVTHQLVKLIRNFKIGGKQIHDANIVATMLMIFPAY